MTDLFVLLQDAFWSGIAAVGFAVLFNVPRRLLIYCAALGAVGHALRTFTMSQFGTGIVIGTLFGALVVGFIAKWLAIHLKTPSMIFGICAAIPMVPGVYAYQAMIGLLKLIQLDTVNSQAILADIAINAVLTGAILGALGLGITAPTFLLDREKPVA